MSISFNLEKGEESVVKIKVVGVGGGGCNVVNRMSQDGPEVIEYIAVNTDKMSLDASRATSKLQIGEKLTHGQGAGADPTVGRKSADESRTQIAKAIEGADMVFITAGMGGGTGTGAAPAVAEIAREAGILTVGVVTKPFSFEGRRRMAKATEGIEELRQKVDSLVIISNDRLKLATGQNVTFANAFRIADDVLRQALQSISDLIRQTGFINLDFADVKAIMKDAGLAHMGVGRAAGKGKAEEAARLAISSPLMETSIHAARGILINVTGSMDVGLDEVEEAASQIQKAVHRDANIIFGAAVDEKMDDEIRVTVIATGFEPDKPEPKPEPRPEAPANTTKGENIKEPIPAAAEPPAKSAPERPSQTVQIPEPAKKAAEAPPPQRIVPQEPIPPVLKRPTPTEAFYGMLDDIVQNAKESAHIDESVPQPIIQQKPEARPQAPSAKEPHEDFSDPLDAIIRIFKRREES